MGIHGYRGSEFYNPRMHAVLDVLNHIQDLDALIQAFVDTVLEVFDCDRVFLLTPLDPEADVFRVPVEATKPEFPGAMKTGMDFPVTSFHRAAFNAVLNADGVIIHGERELAANNDFKTGQVKPAKSAMITALYPRIGKPWMFGLHQCTHERQWRPVEQKLFCDIALRLAETLSNRLLLISLQERERTLRASEERLRISQEIAHVGTWEMSTIGRKMVWSDELFHLLGYAPGEIVPNYHALLSRVHEADQYRVRQAIDGCMQGQGVFDIKCRIRPKNPDAGIRTVRQIGRMYSNGPGTRGRLVSVMQDLTDQAKNETRLQAFWALNKEAANLSERDILSRALDIAVEITESQIGYLHLVHEDQNTLEFAVCNAKTLKNGASTFTNHQSVENAGVWADAVRLKRPVVHNDYPSLNHKNGYPEDHIDLVRHMSAPVMDGFDIVMVIGVGNKQANYTDQDLMHLNRVAEDINKIIMRRRADRALEAKIHELERAIQSAQWADKAKSDLLANMSHELRTPLNSIIGFSHIMETQTFGALSDLYRDYAHLIGASGQHLLKTINQILDLSKIEAGKFELEPQRTDANAIIDECINILDALAKDHGVEVVNEISEDHELMVDPTRMKQVMFNIIGNAIKYTHCGTVRISNECDHMAHRIVVTDTGVGMTKEQANQVMRPFQQVHGQAYARRNGGTGLGLSLAQRIMELHGGTIELASKANEGTRVNLVLPKILDGPCH